MERARFSRSAAVLATITALVALMLVAAAAPAGAGEIYRDDFDGPALGPEWDVKLGSAWLDGGWVVLQHLPGSPGPRDTGIITNEGGDWSDYRVTTRFFAEGGGNNWYRAHLFFRVVDYHGWPATGTFYYLAVTTPLYGYSWEGAGISLTRYKDEAYVSLASDSNPPAGAINDYDNTVEVEVIGDHIKVWVNDWLAFDLVDPDPIPAGGVGLGAVWESRTRFDYVEVTAPTVANVAPTIDAVSGPVAPVDINDQPITVGADFSDPDGADTHTCTVDYDDGAGPENGTVVGGTCTGPEHSYAEPGVYAVEVTVTDDKGGTDAKTFEFVVVYDPDGGFVTGGGWIWSDAGWCHMDAECGEAEGKAHFGFVSKYKKGASTPEGATEFQFQAGGLNFHSESYDWLVIAGQDKAKYKGTGTINGSGDYGFMLTAVDNGNGGDTFRIKIWDRDGGDTVVYDNMADSTDEGYDGTAVAGGNIKVHRP